MRDPLPAILELQGMLSVKHHNDGLVRTCLATAERHVRRGDYLTATMGVRLTLDTVEQVSVSEDARAILQLALTELHRCSHG